MVFQRSHKYAYDSSWNSFQKKKKRKRKTEQERDYFIHFSRFFSSVFCVRSYTCRKKKEMIKQVVFASYANSKAAKVFDSAAYLVFCFRDMLLYFMRTTLDLAYATQITQRIEPIRLKIVRAIERMRTTFTWHLAKYAWYLQMLCNNFDFISITEQNKWSWDVKYAWTICCNKKCRSWQPKAWTHNWLTCANQAGNFLIFA